MLISSMLMVILAAPVGVQIDEIGELSREDAVSLVDELARAITRSTRRDAVWIETPSLACRTALTSCGERGRAGLVLHVRAFAGLRYLRLELEREGEGLDAAKTSLDLVREPELWPAPLEALVRGLIPALPAEAPVGSAPPPAPERTLRPWVLWAGGAALLGLGIGFGASSAAARTRASRPLGPESEAIYLDAADRAQSHAIVADLSFALSALTLAAGGVIYWLESD